MKYLILAIEFFKTGLFAIGGGLTTIPFLFEMGSKYNWFTNNELVNMIAISESTPGPIGINIATYVGYKVGGYFGAVIATLSEILPAVITITIIASLVAKLKDNPTVKKIMTYVRPCTFALLTAAFFNIFFNSVIFLDVIKNTNNIMSGIDIKVIIIFITIVLLKLKTKFHPLIYICISALLGVILL